MRRAHVLVLASIVCLASTLARAQAGYFENWFDRVSSTQAEQPHWITPLVTVTPRLEEEYRFDIYREEMRTGDDLVNLGTGKGVELIPSEHTEVIVALPPPYLIHNNPKLKDGFGDETFLLKYRLLASNEERHNAILTVFLGGSIPTGSHSNGSVAAIVTPTVAAGKGFGPFDVQSTLGVGLPVDSVRRLGRPVAWNTAFQYRLLRKLWPELEVNSTFNEGGVNDGRKQTFLTPGIVVGRIPLHKRLALTFGGGIQIAATHYHAYDHNAIVSVRLPF